LASKELKSCLRLPHSCCQQSGLSREALGCLDKTNWQQAPGSLGWAWVGKRIQTLQRRRSSWKAASRSSLFHVFTLIHRQLYPRLYPVRAIKHFSAILQLKGSVLYGSVPVSSAIECPPSLAVQGHAVAQPGEVSTLLLNCSRIEILVFKCYQKLTRGVIITLKLQTNMPENQN